MTDFATLGIKIDSTQAKQAAGDLDRLAVAGGRAEKSTAGLAGGFRGVGTEATAMASAAQLSARAAMDQAAGFGAATSAARLNTLAMRETLVVAREISRGNFTRLPGSLTLLAQGVGSQGGIGAYAAAISQQLGLIKKVQNAELAEAATAAANAAAGVEAAARKAAANVMAADTEIALAEAQLRVTQGTSAEAVAQARLAAAHEAVAVAAGEAAIAENALAVAQGRAVETGAASAAAARTLIGGTGVGLIGIGAVAAVAYGAVKQFQDQVRDDGTLTAYRDSLGLTHAEMLKLTDGVDTVGGHIKQLGDVTVTWGDVWHGVWGEVTREANDGAPWNNMKNHAVSAFDAILTAWNRVSARITAGLWTIQNLMAGGAGAALGIPAGEFGQVNGGQISLSANYAAALAQNKAAFGGAQSGAINSAKNRMKAEADALKADRRAKKPKKAPKQPVDHANDTIARLDEQILSAKISLTKDATQEAALKVQQLRVERDKSIADAQSLLNTHKITQTEFDTIKVRAEELDNLKERAVLNARDIALLTEDQAAKDQLFGFQADALKAADAQAKTQAEKRQIELDILKITYDQKKYDLQIAEEKARIAGASAAQLALIQRQIDNLPTQQAADKAQVLKSTQDPLHAWLDSVKTTAPEITEALQGIETKGFDSLAQGIAGVVTGTESLGKAFKDISQQIIGDIIQMTVKMLIFRAISGIFGGGIGSPDIGASMSVGVSGQAVLPHLAGGGSMIIGGNSGVDKNVLSLNGSPVAMVGQGETLAVYPNAPHSAANSNQPQVIEVRVVTDENFNASVQQMAGQVVVAAAPTIVKSAVQSAATTFTRKTLNGRR